MNDLVYNEIVATPGYELEFAVGTTYSLDAEIFLAIALSFARLGDATETDFQSPLRLLEGLRQTNSRVAIFCNRCGLQPPVRPNPLYAMLDKSVFEVADERKGKELANFHPKIWVIKERSLDNRDKRQIKLIVMSRNLTKDSSLDIAATMTAPLGINADPEVRHKHRPLKEFLLTLADKANADKRKKIRKLANDLDATGAFELEQPYEDYDLVPIYFGENMNRAIDLGEELPGEKMAVVSPFIDAETLSRLNDYRPKQEKLLVTRLDSLTPEIMDLYSGDNREVWVMSQIAEQNDILPINLHAKMYFSWAPKSGGTHLWLGSSNATRNGFYRNTEFMLRLRLKRGRNQFENFKALFCDEKKNMFEPVTSLPAVETADERNDLTANIRKSLISRNNLSAQVVETNGEYSVTITAKRVKDILGTITIAPIQEPWNEVELNSGSLRCEIKISARSHLSEFYILRVKPFDNETIPVSVVIKIATKGIPEDRDDHIFRSLIDTRDKFLSYVELMITDRPLEFAAQMLHADVSAATGPAPTPTNPCNNLYESLLRKTETSPERVDDLQDLIDRLGADVVPEDVAKLCAIARQSIKKRR